MNRCASIMRGGIKIAKYLSIHKKNIGNMNKRNVLNCIEENQPINRSAIANIVGLSIPSVMTITDELLKKGIIQSVGKVGSGVGKHPEVLTIYGGRFRYVGVDVGRITTRIVITGQDGEVLSSTQRQTHNAEEPLECVNNISRQIKETLEKSDVDINTIVGVCIAMPGLIESETGNVIFSPDFGWKDVPLQKWMQERIPSLHVIVRNANRAQARWETRPGRNNKESTIFCVGLGYGIGSAIISNGEMYYGSSGTSGEIGHITVNPDGPVCLCGNSGCLEAIASGRAIAEQAQQLVREGADTLIGKICNGDIDSISAKTVFEAALSEDKIAIEIIDRAAKYIGIALATAINMLDPDTIYLCGGLMKNGDDFFNRIKKYTKERQMQLAGRHVVILPGSKEDLNVARGATLMIQDSGYEFEALSFLY